MPRATANNKPTNQQTVLQQHSSRKVRHITISHIRNRPTSFQVARILHKRHLDDSFCMMRAIRQTGNVPRPMHSGRVILVMVIVATSSLAPKFLRKYITWAVVQQHGHYLGCTSCHNLPGGHSDACRSRFERSWADEDSIKATPAPKETRDKQVRAQRLR